MDTSAQYDLLPTRHTPDPHEVQHFRASTASCTILTVLDMIRSGSVFLTVSKASVTTAVSLQGLFILGMNEVP